MAQNEGQGGKGQARGVGDQARQVASEVGDRARELGATAAERARDAASSAAETARNVGSQARERAEQGAHALGSGLRSAASTLRQNVPHEGMMGTAASGLADTLERGGTYLEHDGINNLVGDLSTLIRRNPLPAVLVGVGLGFMVAHMFRSER